MKTLLTTLLLTTGLTLPAMADEIITGKVQAFGPGSLITIQKQENGPPMYFHLDEKATWQDAEGASLANKAIFPGSIVKLQYDTAKDDKLVVSEIVVLRGGKPGPIPAPETAATTVTTTTTASQTKAEMPVPPLTAVSTGEKVIVETTDNGVKATKVETTANAVIDAHGEIVGFVPGKSITVTKTELDAGRREPVTYLLREDAVYVTPTGEVIDASSLRPGVPVTVYYTDENEVRGVRKVVVRETATTTTRVVE